MSNIVYKYPLSSCTCYKCTQGDMSLPHVGGRHTNMSVRDCDVNSPYFECLNVKKFSSGIEPQVREGLTPLNPQVLQDKYSTQFAPVKGCKETGSCPSVQWASPDPRLISAAHNGQVLTLDNPPITSGMKLSRVSVDPMLDGYGQGYKGYEDVNAGQIMYYIDHSIEDPFFVPTFALSAEATGLLYRDPMGAMKPQYDRVPLRRDDPLGPQRNNYVGGLSWMQDSLEQREDIMARQMSRSNQERWSPRWRDN